MWKRLSTGAEYLASPPHSRPAFARAGASAQMAFSSLEDPLQWSLLDRIPHPPHWEHANAPSVGALTTWLSAKPVCLPAGFEFLGTFFMKTQDSHHQAGSGTPRSADKLRNRHDTMRRQFYGPTSPAPVWICFPRAWHRSSIELKK